MKKLFFIAILAVPFAALAQATKKEKLLDQTLQDTTFQQYFKSAGFEAPVNIIAKEKDYVLVSGIGKANLTTSHPDIQVTDVRIYNSKNNRNQKATIVMTSDDTIIKTTSKNLWYFKGVENPDAKWILHGVTFRKKNKIVPYLMAGMN